MINGTYYLTQMLPSLLLPPYAGLKLTPKPHDRTSTDPGSAALVTLEIHRTSELHDRPSTDAGSADLITLEVHKTPKHHDRTSTNAGRAAAKNIVLTAAEKRAKKTEKQRLKRQAMSPLAMLAAKQKASESRLIRSKQKREEMTAAEVTQEEAPVAEGAALVTLEVHKSPNPHVRTSTDAGCAAGKKIALTAADKRATKTDKQRLKRRGMSPLAMLAAKKKASENRSIRLKRK